MFNLGRVFTESVQYLLSDIIRCEKNCLIFSSHSVTEVECVKRSLNGSNDFRGIKNELDTFLY